MNPRHLRPAPTPSRAIAPFHRGPQAAPVTMAGMPISQSPNAALLIDFDNVTMGIRSDLQGELNNLLSSDIIKGKVAVRRAYADWRRYPQYIVPLTESSIDLIFAPAYGSAKKNATDIRLAIDAMELVFTRPEIGTFVLLSGDSDFSSMVIKLKEYGKYVIGVGIRESSSDLLVMNCDEYYSYNALAGLTKNGDDESTRWDPWELVTESVTRMKRNGDVMRSDRLKQVMQEIDSSFDEKLLGMPKFSRFVQDAANKGLLKVTKLESGQLEIDAPSADAVLAAAAATGTATSTTTSAPSIDNETPEQRRERERERDERRGRRGRRGRGRDRGDRIERTDTDSYPAVSAETVDGAPALALSSAPVDEISADAIFAPIVDSASAPASAPATRDARGRGRDPRHDRPDRTERRPETAGAQSASFGADVAIEVGTSGERLTRSDAFDLVRRAVESLVQGEASTSASAARQRAFELLGRDSESLSARNFERILQDAHDANMIDLRRRGNDFEVARAADAAPIVDQLKSVEQAQAAVAAANTPPPAPRGMSHRGVAPRGMGGRGKALTAPSAELLMMGVVGPRSVPPALIASAPIVPAVVEAPVVPAVPAVVVEAPVANAEPVAVAVEAVAAVAKRGATVKPVADKAPAKKAAGKAAAKTATKAPAKKAPVKVAKAPAKAAKAPAAAETVVAKKAAKTPVKKVAKAAKK